MRRDASTLSYLGALYFNTGRYQLAASVLREGLQLNPEDTEMSCNYVRIGYIISKCCIWLDSVLLWSGNAFSMRILLHAIMQCLVRFPFLHIRAAYQSVLVSCIPYKWAHSTTYVHKACSFPGCSHSCVFLKCAILIN